MQFEAENVQLAHGKSAGSPCCFLPAMGYGDVMDWQEAIALMIVAGTAGLFSWGRFRRRRFDFKRDTHCGCASPAQTNPQSSIVFRARRGHRPEVVVRMRQP